MKSKTQKSKELKKIKDNLPKSKITIFTTFSRAGEKGLSVSQMSELKKSLRSMGGEYLVSKKTLMDKALKELKYDDMDVYGMDGSIGLVFGSEDPFAIAKKVYEFSRRNQALQFFGAILENGFINKDKFLEIAKMPSREQLLARLVGMLMYPVKSLAIVLNQIENAKIKMQSDNVKS